MIKTVKAEKLQSLLCEALLNSYRKTIEVNFLKQFQSVIFFYISDSADMREEINSCKKNHSI